MNAKSDARVCMEAQIKPKLPIHIFLNLDYFQAWDKESE